MSSTVLIRNPVVEKLRSKNSEKIEKVSELISEMRLPADLWFFLLQSWWFEVIETIFFGLKSTGSFFSRPQHFFVTVLAWGPWSTYLGSVTYHPSSIMIPSNNCKTSSFHEKSRVFSRLLFFGGEEQNKVWNNCCSLKEETLSFPKHINFLKTVHYSWS